MCKKRQLLCLLVGFIFATTARGDWLEFEDGARIRGEGEQIGKIVTFTDEKGVTRDYDRAKGEYKRYVRESRLTPLQVLDMLDELHGLIAPVLEADPPKRFRWLAQVRTSSTRYSYNVSTRSVTRRDSAAIRTGSYSAGTSVSRRRSGTSVSGGSDTVVREFAERIETVDTIFADEWSAYINSILRVRDNLRFQELVTRQLGVETLWDFVRDTPEEHQSLQAPLRNVLLSIENLFEVAEQSKQYISIIPNKKIKLEERLHMAERSLQRAEADLKNASSEFQEKNRQKEVDKRRVSVERHKHELQTEPQVFDRNASQRILDYAHGSATVLNDLMFAIESIHGAPTTETERPRRIPTETERLEEVTKKAQAQIAAYREELHKKTDAYKTRFREETHTSIRDLFAQNRIFMDVYLSNIRERGPGDCELIVVDRPPQKSEPTVRAVLTLDEHAYEKLIRCNVGTSVILEAIIVEVDIGSALEEGVNPDSPITFSVTGNVAAIEKGC